MKWSLRMVAAQRDVRKASELQRMLADAGLVISAGKLSHLWSGRPLTVRLDDLDIVLRGAGLHNRRPARPGEAGRPSVHPGG
ncbi:XRE family transcriptional regulator [Streptomyces sp. NPDC048362]|uniref:XRE family transcriptional regulator n=1 Tax=Streptomyces sp. NPDC048362 TaxID=3365539 RepID=UPI0037210D7F